ncbi:reverse transcriptase (RNA-dependent DNA polymerase) [Nitrospirillum amazonense]|uniref:Reverse transcriptase (RNA-dependent DNA polymerase) n=1 Tax=Nitrospirillum amazonense TaxID=28077 RepID=A0A560FKK3_9PROT|nr:RNA-directed DNA polymerase [Nitrospirillum amazonense]TWB22130.1 reverse transcriptase (RNA-dependent DNA polymerase) [Nitrospirillum amazonense]
MNIDLTKFPISLAIRQLIDYVSYSNAVPDWVDPLVIDYNTREQVIRNLLVQYHSGRSPDAAFEIPIPKKTGGDNVWVVPSINDQIALHACVSAIAPLIENRCIDRSTYSSRLNTVPESLAFIENQVGAWATFKTKIEGICRQKQCLLQLDIRAAYASINLDNFFDFLHDNTDRHAAVPILDTMIRAYSKGRGLPFINDSVFFLGNAYFSKIDTVVRKHGFRFIRFADDYKIFAESTDRLERLLHDLRTQLGELGFFINDDKLRLGTDEEFLDAVASQQYSETLQSADYAGGGGDKEIPGQKKVEALFKLIMGCLEEPDLRLHQGFGRLLIASIRRLRTEGAYIGKRGNAMSPSPSEQLDALLYRSPEALVLACKLLEEYSKDNQHTWRLIWVLYLCRNLLSATANQWADTPEVEGDGQATLQATRDRIVAIMESLSTSSTVPGVIRAWAAKPVEAGDDIQTLQLIERVHRADYEEGGRLWYAR